MILSIDTSLPMLSVAVVSGDRPLGAAMVEGEGSRNEKLLPAVDWLLGEAGIERARIEQVVVTRGPGSFTGVRVGLATAQGIAFSLGIPLAAMSTHEAVVDAGAPSLLVHGDAGRGERYVSGFRNGVETLAPTLAPPDDLACLRGEYAAEIDLDVESRRRCLALAAALRLAASSEQDRAKWSDATPIYVRASEADVRLEARLAAEHRNR